MRTKLFAGVAFAALILPASAFAQSTGTIDAEEGKEIVVTGARSAGVAGVEVPDTTKTRQVLNSEFIQHQVAGQSINETINMMPGVSFQNNDPYGSSGGTLTIRGFDASRISQTFDGIPLNDTGNYAIYSNQQLDPELIEQVNVSLGSTDIDSPTASASGSTVNYRSRTPTEDFHVRAQLSVGDWDMTRVFGVVDTGNFTPWGTRAWVAASHAENANPFNRAARVDKSQYNAKLYQPIGSNGDFISVAGHYNINRNNNFSSLYIRNDQTILTVSGTSPNQVLNSAPRVVGSSSSNRIPLTKDERFYNLGSCTTAAARAGVTDTTNTCGTAYDYSYNPSDTANIRANSKFTLADGLVLTIDPSYEYTRANGGASAVKGNEGTYTRTGLASPIYGYIGGAPYFGGVDLNGDGDTRDAVELYAPSHTETRRYILISSLRWDMDDTNTIRVSYTHDYGHHRQTGEIGTLQLNGYATHVFPKLDPLLDASGNPIEKRNRKSLAILDQVSGEYRGKFFDDRLQINGGVTAKFFKRDLTNYCASETGSNAGFVDCINDPTMMQSFLTATGYQAPQNRNFTFNKVLPTAGLSYDLTNALELYANFSEGIQVPGTDNLYNSFALPVGTAGAIPKPETTDNYDAGVRYRSGKIQAQLAGWYTLFNNRLASAYDPEQNITIYRNLGKVQKYGIDGSISYQPIKEISLYAFGSYLKSKIHDNVQTGGTAAAPVYALTAGKRESGAPTYTFGGRVEADLGLVDFGAQAKRTGPRYMNDQNLPVTQSYTLNGTTTTYQVYGAKTPAYTVVDLDARISLKQFGVSDRTYLQLNITNLFDQLYIAGFSGTLASNSVRTGYIGAPRTFSGTLVVGF